MKDKRNEEMFLLRLEGGLTLEQIGKRYDLSRQRIHSVVGKTRRYTNERPEKKPEVVSQHHKFWDLVQVLSIDVCWPWQGAKSGQDRYGVIRVGSKMKYAHRVAYELTFGPIPDGLYACHKCDNPPCCNPHHIFSGTPSENVLDSVAKGRWTMNHRKKAR